MSHHGQPHRPPFWRDWVALAVAVLSLRDEEGYLTQPAAARDQKNFFGPAARRVAEQQSEATPARWWSGV